MIDSYSVVMPSQGTGMFRCLIVTVFSDALLGNRYGQMIYSYNLVMHCQVRLFDRQLLTYFTVYTVQCSDAFLECSENIIRLTGVEDDLEQSQEIYWTVSRKNVKNVSLKTFPSRAIIIVHASVQVELYNQPYTFESAAMTNGLRPKMDAVSCDPCTQSKLSIIMILVFCANCRMVQTLSYNSM